MLVCWFFCYYFVFVISSFLVPELEQYFVSSLLSIHLLTKVFSLNRFAFLYASRPDSFHLAYFFCFSYLWVCDTFCFFVLNIVSVYLVSFLGAHPLNYALCMTLLIRLLELYSPNAI